MSSLRTTRFVAMATLALLLVSACTEANAPVEPGAHESTGSVAFGRGDGPGGRGAPEWSAELTARLASERARIEARRAANRGDLDSLKREYDTFKRGLSKRKPTTLLVCEPEPYAAETKVIGPEGGELAFGPHKIRIARGTLTEPTLITAEAPSALLVAAELSPHGLVFENAVELELSYARCTLPADFRKLRAVYLDEQDNILEYPDAIDFRKGDKVLSRIRHFSKYAVAY